MIICIQARMGSSRLPGKVMMPLYGEPMLFRLIERLRKTDLPIVVCTGDDERNKLIMEACHRWGVGAFRSFEQDVMSRLVLAGELTEHKDIIRVTGDNPLTSPKILKLLVKSHLKNEADYTYTEGTPTGVRCEVINVQALKKLREKTDDEELQENMTPALKTMNKVQRFPCLVDWQGETGFTVDTPEDMRKMIKIYNHFKGHPPEIEELNQWANS